MSDLPDSIGPVLFSRGATEARHKVRVILAMRGAEPPPVGPCDAAPVEPARLYEGFGWRIFGWDFEVEGDRGYRCGEENFPVRADMRGRTRIAFASCNGQEDGDFDRPEAERNALWARMALSHEEDPFGLALHGGDQLYADDILESHPEISRWRAADLDGKQDIAFTEEMGAAAEKFLLERYLRIYAMPSIHEIGVHVPSLMMWDDHDIFDGWGSHPAAYLDSAVARGVYGISERMFRIFQLGRGDGEVAREGGFGFATHYPGFSVVAPDLRTSRRPERVMDDEAWAQFERCLAEVPPGNHVLLLSSVPALGPRLSWVEAMMGILPGAQKYEDDLRDQWQSRAHRAEWKRFLGLLEKRMIEEGPVIMLSGEIHLATRAEMVLSNGAVMHQLVASGIAHTPPPWGYARSLGALSLAGESPLPGRPIRIRTIPGQRHRYIERRNYLTLLRDDGHWSASWALEDQPDSPPLTLA